jgi:hypothetical protein
MLDDTVMLLTATVNPKNMPGSIADPLQRLDDYLKVFRYYLDNHPAFNKIVIAENSGWPLEPFHQAGRRNHYGKQLEFISLDENDFPREFGKGYGEHNILIKAVNTSKLIAGAEYFAKMTGRHYLMNASQIIAKVRCPIDVLCDFRDHPIYEILGSSKCGRHCDTRFMVFRREFFLDHMSGLAEGHEVGEFSLEANYYQAIKPLNDGRRVLCRFPVEPIYRGVAGHWGKNYSGVAERLKQRVRGVSRRICPWLRI